MLANPGRRWLVRRALGCLKVSKSLRGCCPKPFTPRNTRRRAVFHDIGFSDNSIDLRRNHVRAKGGWVEKPSTKTGRGRYIDIDDGMALIRPNEGV